MVKTEDQKAITIAILKGYGLYSSQEKESAIVQAIMWSSLYNGGFKPGEAYKRLPEETKKVLKDCKSDDWFHRV